MKKGLLILLAIGGSLVLLWLLIFGGIYNKLVAGDENVTQAWAQVENVYQRRMDLIPNLVETVKGYASHEKETLQSVVEARAKASQMTISPEVLNQPEAFRQFQKVQGELSSALSRLMVVAEQYPDLKANQNFMALQSQLEGTENRITVERMRYNQAAQTFNTRIRQFPDTVVAHFMGLGKKAYFQAEKNAAQVPKVQF